MFGEFYLKGENQGIAQSGRAGDLGSSGHRFKSYFPDLKRKRVWQLKRVDETKCKLFL